MGSLYREITLNGQRLLLSAIIC